MRLLIAASAAAILFYGTAARAFLVRPLHRFHFLLRRAVRVRTTRFRQGDSEGICPREIIRRKTGRGNRENKEEPVKRSAMSLQKIRGRCRESFYRQRSKKLFCILDLQNWPGQMCCEKTGIWRGSNRGLRGDFAFGQLLDNA